MKQTRTLFGRLLRGAAVLALTALLLSSLPVLSADAAGKALTQTKAAAAENGSGITIKQQPHDAWGKRGENAVFTVYPTGTGLTYRWQYNNGHGWRNSTQEGCRTKKITVPFYHYRNEQQYRCIITDAYGETVISQAARMHIHPVTVLPKNAWVRLENNDNPVAVFTIKAELPLSMHKPQYQWQIYTTRIVDGVETTNWFDCDYPGSQSTTLTVPYKPEMDCAEVRCVVTADIYNIRQVCYAQMFHYHDTSDDDDLYGEEGDSAVDDYLDEEYQKWLESEDPEYERP